MSEAEVEAEYYHRLGLITDYERRWMEHGYCVVNHFEELVWLQKPRWDHIVLPEPRQLNPDRMIEIQADQLAGIGDGRTTLPQNLNEE